MKQIVKLSDCIACRECCRFYKGYEHLAPIIEKGGRHFRIVCTERKGNYYICPFLKEGFCMINSNKPYDCAIYPFNIMRDRKGAVVLAYDKSCKGLRKKSKKELLEYADYLADYIEKKKILKKKHYIEPFQKELTPIKKL
jgi:Fe-S-cluster containining protein